jgi:hypothetical protein
MTDKPIQINFEKLENEVKSAIYADEKYSRENSTKLRAIEQRVGTYEDFRQMVLASHLKPLDKGESLKSDLLNKNTWNLIAAKANGDEPLKLDTNQTGPSHKQPLNSLEFIQAWKKLPDAVNIKWQYVVSVGPEAIQSLFSHEINGEILGHFIGLFNTVARNAEMNSDENIEKIVHLLNVFPKCNRFKLNFLFLKKDELESCKLLFEELLQRFDNREPTSNIDMNSLKSLYL